MLRRGPEFVRAFLSTAVTIALLWALTRQNAVWVTGHEAARDQAHHDELTGLPNRRRLLQRLQTLADERAQASVAMVDIDHFKEVNDTHGHDVGDVALVAVADTLAEQIRDGDLVARWGGEEFVVVIEGGGRRRALAAAERCREAVAATRPRREDDDWFPPITVSIGVASIEPGDTPVDALARADEQLYRAKRAGRDCVRHAGDEHPTEHPTEEPSEDVTGP